MKLGRVKRIAPCGMDCTLCYACQREKDHCDGCREGSISMSRSCLNCGIRNCPKLLEEGYAFCYECTEYPCRRLRQMDKRYRSKYHMSVLENLESIRDQGLEAFLKSQDQRFTCPNCGELVCVHKPACFACGEAVAFPEVEEHDKKDR